MTVLKNKRVLIVDPDQPIRLSLKDAFAKLGSKAFAVSDGEQALYKMSAEGLKFDVMIFELALPNSNGLELLNRMNSYKLIDRQIIIFMSTDLDAKIVEVIKSKGFTYVAKPFVLRRFIDKTMQLICVAIKKPYIDPLVVKSFVASAKDVFSFYFKSDPVIGKPLISKQVDSEFLVSRIEFRGKTLTGYMSIYLNDSIIQLLQEKIFPGDGSNTTLNEQDKVDLTGEICNQILGKVKMYFEKLNLEIQLSLPKHVLPRDSIMSQNKGEDKKIMIPIKPFQKTLAASYIDFFMEIDLSGSENSLEGKSLDQKDTDKNIRIIHESRDHFIDFED
ncbi:MAG: response regulator [Oligoflexales bacterium]